MEEITLKKNHYRIFALAVAVLFSVALAIPPSVHAQLMTKKDLLKAWDGMAEYTLALANKMPADKFDYKPVDVLRNFAEQLNHIAGTNYFMGRILNAEGAKRPSATEKEAVLKDLKDSFDFVKAAIDKMPWEKMTEEIDWFPQGTKKPRFHALLFMIDHLTHTRGISLMYVRMQGIAPPPDNAYKSW